MSYIFTEALLKAMPVFQTEISQQILDGLVQKFCTGIRSSRTMNDKYFSDPLTFPLAPPLGSHFGFWVLTIGWISVAFGTHMHAPLRMNCNPLPFHFVPSSHQNFNLSNSSV